MDARTEPVIVKYRDMAHLKEKVEFFLPYIRNKKDPTTKT